MNTAMASFNTTVRQMTEMSQWKKNWARRCSYCTKKHYQQK